MFQELLQKYKNKAYDELGKKHLDELYQDLPKVDAEEIISAEDGKNYIELLKKFREAVAENDKFHGTNYTKLLRSVLSVGEDGLYSNNLRFIFELIQNVDDCDYEKPEFCCLDMRFDFKNDRIVLTYNETGFTPANVFAITGIAEAAKNVDANKNEIGEKGIGFKSVFGVAEKVWIRSNYFSFELSKNSFTIPVYRPSDCFKGTQMTLYVPQKARRIYTEIKEKYCKREALFSQNPILFLNKLTSLKITTNNSESLEFIVSRSQQTNNNNTISIEKDVKISIKLKSPETIMQKEIYGTRYSYPVVFSPKACQSRYGRDTLVGQTNGKPMVIRALFINPEYISEVETGALYSFLPTQLRLRIPVVCHVPFKLDASREFVDPQEENLWFREASKYLSRLLDEAYMDWRTTVKEKIVSYLVGYMYGIFKSNNGKEDCLKKQVCFSGKHYLDMPLFYTEDHAFHSANDIFSFHADENITEQEKVRVFLGLKKHLFVSPVPLKSADGISKFGFTVESGIMDRLFKKALSHEQFTAGILDYLDSAGYVYNEKQLSNIYEIMLNKRQIETVFEHKQLAEMLCTSECNRIKQNNRLMIRTVGTAQSSLHDLLGSDFDISETPKQIEKFMKYCGESGVCLDIGEDNFLPCKNTVVLSKSNPLASFAAFCKRIDKTDTFSIRISLREASKKLNQFEEEESGSPSDYLRSLRNIRSMIKDSLGHNGYKSYIDLILRSGTDRGRFIQELLQNADDCCYLAEVIPTFSLTQKGNTVITEYNEIGFSRANIRSITAIGESTKNKLFEGKLAAIGEKGVGFKTVFAAASEVRIHSGEYHFSLSAQEPTIPKILKNPEQETTAGTRMELILSHKASFPSYDEKTILKLCLCLRKLRMISIGSHTVSIQDESDKRIITIDNHQHVFRRFIHSFHVTDTAAIDERRNGTREISSEQKITCFIPEKGGLAEYYLYSGLPTKHRIKIPLAIDAPFSLTTSREEIETESSSWNNIVRKELYTAIIKLMHFLKSSEREKIFRLIKLDSPKLHGNVRVYPNDISDCSYLTSFDYLRALKAEKILPTFDKNVFEIPQNKKAFRYPEAAMIIFEKVSQSEYAGIRPSSVIDVVNKNNEPVLNALDCQFASFQQVFPIIQKHAERLIQEDVFRSKLYEYLQTAPAEYKEVLKKLAIIPVYGRTPGSIEYLSWKEDSIFVKRNTDISCNDYYVLNERQMPKAVCEKIFDVNINEMNLQWEHNRYNERLKKILKSDNIERIYQFLIREYRSGALQRNESSDTLRALSEMIPLKNELGELVDTALFICDQPSGYFASKMIQRLIVHKECEEFARYIKCGELRNVHYEDMDYYETLTADDVEALLDEDYTFLNSEEILRGFYKDDFLTDELISEYELTYLTFRRSNEQDTIYEFPSVSAGDRNLLTKHISTICNNPIRVVSVEEVRTVKKGKNKSGDMFNLDISDAREGVLKIYSPAGVNGLCFCQMCRKAKSRGFIEVNNIEKDPSFFFPQLRISLCLECSKEFEALRHNSSIGKAFINAIKNSVITNQGLIDVPIGNEKSIRFTAKHLAEIQEIMRQMKIG